MGRVHQWVILVKFYQDLPDFMRPTVVSNTLDIVGYLLLKKSRVYRPVLSPQD